MDFVYWFYIVICFLYKLYVAFLHFWWTYELTRNLFTSGLGIRSHHRICQDQCRLSFLMANPSAPMVRLAIYCYLLLRYIAIWCFALVFQLWYWHDLTIWCCEKNLEKNLHLNVQCTVQRLCLTILRGMPPLWGGEKIKRWRCWGVGFGNLAQKSTSWKGEAGWNMLKPWLWKIWGWVFNWFGPLMFSRWGGDCYVGLSFFVWRLTIQRDWQPVIASFWPRWCQALSFQAKEKEPDMWDGRKAMLFSDHVSSKHFLIFLACCLHTFQSCSWIELKM